VASVGVGDHAILGVAVKMAETPDGLTSKNSDAL
jgi:hypothetical protein